MAYANIRANAGRLNYEIEIEYEVSNLIDSNNERCDNARVPAEWKPKRRLGPDDVYPQKGEYVFQEFAGPVFEFGGYGDITMVDPYTLDRLWISQAGIHAAVGANASGYDWMRVAIDVAEAIGFGAREEGDGR
jgi:hypothetical protein